MCLNTLSYYFFSKHFTKQHTHCTLHIEHSHSEVFENYVKSKKNMTSKITTVFYCIVIFLNLNFWHTFFFMKYQQFYHISGRIFLICINYDVLFCFEKHISLLYDKYNYNKRNIIITLCRTIIRLELWSRNIYICTAMFTFLWHKM